MDLDKVIITQRSSSQNIDPVEMPIPEQFLETNFLYSYMIASLPGAWTIEGYVIDDKGNRSNTVTKKITVN
jgi:hypothetical protein